MSGLFFGVALLAGSWLFGLAYYQLAAGPAWAVTVVLGVALLQRAAVPLPDRRTMLLALVLLALPVLLVPWPYGVGPLLMCVGLAVGLLAERLRAVARLAPGAIAAGAVLLVQGLAAQGYTAFTARAHELPEPLVELLAGLARLWGADASSAGEQIAIRTLRGVHYLAATWDLLVDPVSVWFLVGCCTVFALLAASRDYGPRACLAAAGRLALLVAIWLPLRAMLLVAIFVDRVQRFTAPTPLHVMNHFFAPWVQVALVGLLALVAWRLVKIRACRPVHPADAAPNETVLTRRPWPAIWVAVAAALFTAAIYWDPPGRVKAGRVMFVERHSTWEPSVRPYDTQWYGEPSGYNYYAAFDYCRRYFEMSHLLESEPIDDRRLAGCDVLVIKTPTARYEPKEIDAIERFVNGGGGLLLIGEHTNFERTSTYLNDIGRRFGFGYRHDLLFAFGVAYDQLFRHSVVPHPTVQYVPPTDFAVSCSIDPGTSQGKAAITSTGLWSLPPSYSTENFFPVPNHRPEMRYGAFIQLWAAQAGQGRVLAFTDSTIFSNFCLFEPGKLDLLLGMLAWLNQSNMVDDPRNVLLVLGLVPLAIAGWLLRRTPVPLVLLLAAGTCGAVVAGQAVAMAHRWSVPKLVPQRPMTRVMIDRTLSDVPLTKSGFTASSGQGFGIVEQWIARLGYFPSRAVGQEAFGGQALLVLCPSRPVSDSYRQSLVEWVAKGGKLLVVDTPENSGSTANRLLEPFKLSVVHGQAWQGDLVIGKGSTGVRVDRACALTGGEPLARIGDHPVATLARHGQGRVMLVGFGSLLNDQHMGSFWNVEPDAPTRARYDLFFGLMRKLIEDRPLVAGQ
jgi:hypothetical protein